MDDISADVRLAQRGSAEAFSRLYSTVYKDMYHIALYSLRSSHDAADAVSEAVLDAFRTLKKLRNPEKFRSWIMSILSAKIKRMQSEYFYVSEEISDMPQTDGFDFESVELRDALNRLDGESRLLLSMAVLGGYSGKEIASICKIKPGTVRSKLSRIKEKLRLELL